MENPNTPNFYPEWHDSRQDDPTWTRFEAWTQEQREEFRKRQQEPDPDRWMDFAADADAEREMDAREEREIEQDRAEDVE